MKKKEKGDGETPNSPRVRAHTERGLEFDWRVGGCGLGVEGLGIRVEDSGLRVEG